MAEPCATVSKTKPETLPDVSPKNGHQGRFYLKEVLSLGLWGRTVRLMSSGCGKVLVFDI